MLDQPDADLILDQLASALRQGVPEGFQQRVAANAVDLARRERQLAPEIEAAELARLAFLLGQAGPNEALNEALSNRITSDPNALQDNRLVRHLIRTVIDKMRVDQPNYPAFRELYPAESTAG